MVGVTTIYMIQCIGICPSTAAFWHKPLRTWKGTDQDLEMEVARHRLEAPRLARGNAGLLRWSIYTSNNQRRDIIVLRATYFERMWAPQHMWRLSLGQKFEL